MMKVFLDTNIVIDLLDKREPFYIDAVELDCTYKGINLHLLGYNFDYTLPIFEAIEQNIYQQMLNIRDKTMN